jgi:hypothetical protein
MQTLGKENYISLEMAANSFFRDTTAPIVQRLIFYHTILSFFVSFPYFYKER